MDTLTLAELIALGGDPLSTHACLRLDGSLYFCTDLQTEDELREEEFWHDRGYAMKRVEPLQPPRTQDP